MAPCLEEQLRAVHSEIEAELRRSAVLLEQLQSQVRMSLRAAPLQADALRLWASRSAEPTNHGKPA